MGISCPSRDFVYKLGNMILASAASLIFGQELDLDTCVAETTSVFMQQESKILEISFDLYGTLVSHGHQMCLVEICSRDSKQMNLYKINVASDSK